MGALFQAPRPLQWYWMFTTPKWFLWCWTSELQDSNFPVPFLQHILAFAYLFIFVYEKLKGREVGFMVGKHGSSVASPGLHTSSMNLLPTKTGLQKIRPDYPSISIPVTCSQGKPAILPLQLSRLLCKIQFSLLAHPILVNFYKMHVYEICCIHQSRTVRIACIHTNVCSYTERWTHVCVLFTFKQASLLSFILGFILCYYFI